MLEKRASAELAEFPEIAGRNDGINRNCRILIDLLTDDGLLQRLFPALFEAFIFRFDSE